MNDTPIYVVGGQQKRIEGRPSDEWKRFGTGVIHRVDPSSGQATVVVEYESPAEATPDEEPSIVFKSGSIDNGKLHVCTQTEIMAFDMQTWERSAYLSLPGFNDVHHVVTTDRDTRLVAVTGLDMVAEYAADGDAVREWGAVGQEPFGDRFDRMTDYRKMATTKPHASHPNFVFEYGDEVWVSRFEQKDAICLTNPDRRIDIGVERPHDGVVRGNLVYFTTVDSHVVIANLDTCEVVDVVDLYAIADTDDALGWSRGLLVRDDDTIVVGFSTLRVTKIRQNVRWVKERFGRMEKSRVLSTHIAAFDLTTRKLLWRHYLDDPRMDVIFSVLQENS